MKIPSANDALANAQILLRDRYAGAEFAIASGSIIRGHGKIGSDLDLVVVYPQLEAAYRESFIFNAMPIEAFVHDDETIQSFINEDYADSESTLMHMITTGKVIPEETAQTQKLQKYCAELIAKGPTKLGEEKRNALRYTITDLIDDLRGDRPPEEIRAIFYTLYAKFAELALRNSGHFLGTGKYTARNLKNCAPDLLVTLEQIGHVLHTTGLNAKHFDILANALAPYGGVLFDGDLRKAPRDKRTKPVWLSS